MQLLLPSPSCSSHRGCLGQPALRPLPLRRAKMLATTARPHNQRDAEAAGGMGAPDNGQRLRGSGQAAMDV